MHPEAFRWVEQVCVGGRFDLVVELGSRDVNGTIRDLFDCDEFVGVDIDEGPGVDVVCDAADFMPERPAGCVVSTEMLEHTPRARESVLQAFRMLAPGGVFVMTAAGPGRHPHSAVDGMALRDGEHYENIDPDRLTSWLNEAGFVRYRVDVQRRPADIRCVAYRPEV